jgi:hypothetical protein
MTMRIGVTCTPVWVPGGWEKISLNGGIASTHQLSKSHCEKLPKLTSVPNFQHFVSFELSSSEREFF